MVGQASSLRECVSVGLLVSELAVRGPWGNSQYTGRFTG